MSTNQNSRPLWHSIGTCLILLFAFSWSHQVYPVTPPEYRLPGNQGAYVYVAHVPSNEAKRESILRHGFFNITGRDTFFFLHSPDDKGSVYARTYQVRPVIFRVPKYMIGYADRTKGNAYQFGHGLALYNPVQEETNFIPADLKVRPLSWLPPKYIVPQDDDTEKKCPSYEERPHVALKLMTDIDLTLHSMGIPHYNMPGIGRLQDIQEARKRELDLPIAQLALGPNWQSRFQAMKDGKYPLAFQDAAQYQRFMRELSAMLKKNHLEGAFGIRGTATQFFSGNPFKGADLHQYLKTPELFTNKPMDLHFFDKKVLEHGGSEQLKRKSPAERMEIFSDLDVHLLLPALALKMQAQKVQTLKHYEIYPAIQSLAQIPNLSAFKQRWEKELGRAVNFSIYQSPLDRYEFTTHPFTQTTYQQIPPAIESHPIRQYQFLDLHQKNSGTFSAWSQQESTGNSYTVSLPYDKVHAIHSDLGQFQQALIESGLKNHLCRLEQGPTLEQNKKITLRLNCPPYLTRKIVQDFFIDLYGKEVVVAAPALLQSYGSLINGSLGPKHLPVLLKLMATHKEQFSQQFSNALVELHEEGIPISFEQIQANEQTLFALEQLAKGLKYDTNKLQAFAPLIFPQDHNSLTLRMLLFRLSRHLTHSELNAFIEQIFQSALVDLKARPEQINAKRLSPYLSYYHHENETTQKVFEQKYKRVLDAIRTQQKS